MKGDENMALGYLMVLYIVILALAIILQGFLYRGKIKDGRGILVANMLLGIGLAYLAYTSLPNNYTMQKVLAAGLGIVALVGTVLAYRKEGSIVLAKLLTSLSVVGGLIQLII